MTERSGATFLLPAEIPVECAGAEVPLDGDHLLREFEGGGEFLCGEGADGGDPAAPAHLVEVVVAGHGV